MSSKSFLQIPRNECLTVYKEVLKNSDKKWESGVRESMAGEFGSAISLQIISIEEMIKAILVLMDGKGFPIRNIKGMNTFFKNHQIRHLLAYILLILGLFGEEAIKFLKSYRDKPKELITLFKEMNTDPGYFEKKYKIYMLRKLIHFKREFEWFARAEILRQDGLYVDYVDQLRSPVSISETEYRDIFNRLIKVREFGNSIIESFAATDAESIKAHRIVIKQFREKQMRNGIEEALKIGKRDPFNQIRKRLE